MTHLHMSHTYLIIIIFFFSFLLVCLIAGTLNKYLTSNLNKCDSDDNVSVWWLSSIDSRDQVGSLLLSLDLAIFSSDHPNPTSIRSLQIATKEKVNIFIDVALLLFYQ